MSIDINHVVTFKDRNSFLEKALQTFYEIIDLAFVKKAPLAEVEDNIENWLSAWDASVDWDNEGKDNERHGWVDEISDKLMAMRNAILETKRIFAVDEKFSSAKIKSNET